MKLTKNHMRDVPRSWSQIPCGEYYRDTLAYQLCPILEKIYGFHLIKIGNLSAEVDTGSCAISHQVSIDLTGKQLQVYADPFNLPLESKSVDACLLAHTLAWSSDPHRLLREVDRVLIDDGWIIISGFNLFSILGIGKFIPVLYHKVPWNSHMFTQIRLMDWLSLLNYEVVLRLRCQVLPWRPQGGKVISTHLPALGCLNLIIARKRNFPLIIKLAKKISSQHQLGRPVSAANQFYKHIFYRDPDG